MKNTLISVGVYEHTAHSVLCVCMTQKWAAYACRTNLWMPATISWRLFAHLHTLMNISEGLSNAYAALSLLARLLCCKSLRDISSGSCHGVLWAALRSHTSLFRHACMVILIRKHHMRAYLTRWWNPFYWRMSPLNDRSKLRRQCSDFKNGCGPSVRPSLNPHSIS